MKTPRAKKSLGQHFLFDHNILSKMIRSAGINADLPVFEIGPGPGGLTRELLAEGCHVIALEKDRDMISHLQQEFATELKNKQLTLISADVLNYDWTQILSGNKPWQVIGNIPYNISTEILFRFVAARAHCVSGTFMVQKEVAERAVAKPNSKTYGVLSIGLQLACRTRILFNVGRKSFVPPPKVESAILHLDSQDAPYPRDQIAVTTKLVRKAFQQRRKTLRNALLHAYPGQAQAIDATLQTLELSPKLRSENIAVPTWIALAQSLDKAR